MVETIRAALVIPEVMKRTLTEYNLQERSADYVVIQIENEKVTNPSLDEIESYYNENKQNY